MTVDPKQLFEKYAPAPAPVADPAPAAPAVDEKTPFDDPAPAEPTNPAAKAPDPAPKPAKPKAGRPAKTEPAAPANPSSANPAPEPDPKASDPAPAAGDPTPSETRAAADDFLKSLEDDPAPAGQGTPPAPTKDEYAVKAKQYDEVISDPLVSAVLAWRQAGGQNPQDFIKNLSGPDVSRMEIGDFIREEAIKEGFEGQELEDAVREKVAAYEELPKLDQRKMLNEYQRSYSSKVNDKLSQFVKSQSEAANQFSQIQVQAEQDLEKSVGELAGKKFKNMLITPEMAEIVKRDAPLFATQIVGDDGRVTGFDVQTGVEMAIWKNFGKKILKETYMLGLTIGKEEAVNERLRVSDNPAPNAGAPAPISGVDTALKAMAEKKYGKPRTN